MVDGLKQIEKLLFESDKYKISNIIQDEEAREYFGYDFEAGNKYFKIRKAKITPKKVGQFVTLWRRNSNNQTEPFNELDKFDYYIIITEEREKYGFFLFPKSELLKRNILSTISKEGKRGFRVYPNWTTTTNKQAEKTQVWQSSYFVGIDNDSFEWKDRLRSILANK